MKKSRSPRYSERSDYDEDYEAEVSSPSSPPVRDDGFQYDVFLNFRGADIRNSFTGHLYYALEEKGIVTFIDNEKLEKGKVEDLFECIRRSKIFMPIFSKGYADSKWCLKEIAARVECKGLIVPVFFDVEPRDVRHQTGLFADAFTRHSTNNDIDKEEVSKWRGALTEAAEVQGYALAQGDPAKLVRLIVKRIVIKLLAVEPKAGFQYDVFLSFRGPDTRNHFTGHLYDKLNDRGIVTFIDSEKLEKGQRVEDLFEYIQRSNICVPIFSKGYADSEWCLKEIVAAVECKRLIVPVFFDVEPRDVRHQSGPFAQAFRRHRKNNKIDKEEVSKWRRALTKAGEVSGYNLADANGCNGDQAKLVRFIVKRILREINKTPLHVVEHPVGLVSRIADLMKLLDVEAQDEVKMVGIYALSGMGKTTLAKAVYNEISTRFDACSFIFNVREAAKQPTGLVSLQKQLLHDVFNDENVNVNSTAQGIGIIEKRIGSKKVLLVLDDVDHKSQLDALAGGVNWFSSGSRIIITTRDQQILTIQSVLNKYEVKGLDDTQSLQLFSWHAFGKEEPNAKFAELSKEVAATAAGLPLALEIFGSHFFDLDEEKQWKDMLKKLRKDQNKDIHEKLKISYDALDEEGKRVFLDIACFFIGNGRKLATLMWEDCKFFPHLTIEDLKNKSLVNINDDTKEFEMHDQIRDMGRKIIQVDPKMCSSRLWKDANETLNVLENKREKENVEAIQLFWILCL